MIAFFLSYFYPSPFLLRLLGVFRAYIVVTCGGGCFSMKCVLEN